jgi:Mce-associated membrane protein
LTAVLEAEPQEGISAETESSQAASWLSRAGALGIDVLFPLFVAAAVALAWFTASPGSWAWWVTAVAGVLIVLSIVVNRQLLPGVTGWSLGRALFGIAVVRSDGEPAGPWRLLVRDVAHLLDTAALFVGWLWPLWDARNRTFADLLTRTEVRRVDGDRPDVRRGVAAALAAGAVIAAGSAGLTYLTVYRQEQAVDAARAEVSEQGPRIVEKILSYNPGTMKETFAQTQDLVTDAYRPQLVDQQHRIEKNPAALNEYFAVTSSVLPGTTPERATMLIYLLGQRQAQQQEARPSTATARVTFEKSGGKWRVSNVEVFPKPLIGAGAP